MSNSGGDRNRVRDFVNCSFYCSVHAHYSGSFSNCVIRSYDCGDRSNFCSNFINPKFNPKFGNASIGNGKDARMGNICHLRKIEDRYEADEADWRFKDNYDRMEIRESGDGKPFDYGDCRPYRVAWSKGRRDEAIEANANLEKSIMTEPEQKSVVKLLISYDRAFALEPRESGICDILKCDIDTGKARPISNKPRRVPPNMKPAIEQQVNEYLDEGIIKETSSPWAAPIVMVKKPLGQVLDLLLGPLP